MDKAETWLKKTLDYRFNDAGLFEQALTHRSAPGNSNERLEFLGDAVLDVVVSEALFCALPDAAEGDLSRLRASLVRDSSLAELAADLGLGQYLILGSGERKAGGHLFYNLVQPYVNACLQEKQFDEAEKAVKNLLRDFDAQKGSILDNDMRKLISTVEGAR